MMSEAINYTLAKVIKQNVPEMDRNPSANMKYVYGGGAVLDRVPWQKGAMRDTISSYACYFSTRYGQATVVFDGYTSGPSTNDAAGSK